MYRIRIERIPFFGSWLAVWMDKKYLAWGGKSKDFSLYGYPHGYLGNWLALVGKSWRARSIAWVYVKFRQSEQNHVADQFKKQYGPFTEKLLAMSLRATPGFVVNPKKVMSDEEYLTMYGEERHPKPFGNPDDPDRPLSS